jgi:hypothetical protein
MLSGAAFPLVLKKGVAVFMEGRTKLGRTTGIASSYFLQS